MRPLYRHEINLTPGQGHPGLKFGRFFDGYTSDWEKDETTVHEEIGKMAGPQGDTDVLNRYNARLMALVESLGGRCDVFRTTWRFVTGLGLPHPAENGFLWHPILGTPYLNGAAVKGLLRAWLEQWEEDPELAARWCGDAERSGEFIFFDAVPVGQPRLAVDILTPHMNKWYQEGEKIRDLNKDWEKVPADWHEPVPNPFLVVDQAHFIFAIAPRNPGNSAEVEKVFDALERALETLGAGAKTAVGYGQWRCAENAHELLQSAVIERQAYIDAANSEQERHRKLEAMEPLQREIEELIETDSKKAPEKILLDALDAGRWDGDDVREVAREIQKRMEQRNTWRLTTKKKKPEKDEAYKATLRVLKYLDE